MPIEEPFFDPSPEKPEQESPVPCDRELTDPVAEKACTPSNETVGLGPDLGYLQVGGGLNGQGAIFFDPERMIAENNMGNPVIVTTTGPSGVIRNARWTGLDPIRTYLAHSFDRTYSVVNEGPIP